MHRLKQPDVNIPEGFFDSKERIRTEAVPHWDLAAYFDGMFTRFAILRFMLSFLVVQFVVGAGTVSVSNYLGYAGSVHLLVLILALAIILISIGLIFISDITLIHSGHVQPYGFKRRIRIVEIGVYARNRHPRVWLFSLCFAGWGLLSTGEGTVALVLGSLILLVLGSFTLLISEPALKKKFGNAYNSYRQRTPFLGYRLTLNEYERFPFIHLMAGFIALVWFRVRYESRVEGLENIPHDKPFIVIAPHESYFDPFFFGVYIPFRVFYITTADVYTTGLMRFLLGALGTFPIERHKQDLRAIRRMLKLSGDGQVVGIFPEGGRSIDGLPQEIQRETVKLIKRCGVDLLPVKMEGAGEIWPRWAPNRRVGKIHLNFQPIIPHDPERSLEDLHQLIKESIFIEPPVPQKVRSKEMTAGITTVLWACVNCGTKESLEIVDGSHIHCTHCRGEWKLEPDYTLHAKHDRAWSIPEWLEVARAKIEPGSEGRYLQTHLEKYYTPNEAYTEELSLQLDKTGFTLQLEGDTIHWPFKVITIFTVDDRSSFSLGVAGLRHTFRLPGGETPLKWEDHYKHAKASITT